MKKINILKMIIFIFIILVPIVTFNLKKDVVSEIDNRKLMNIEDIFTSDDLTDGIQSFIDDRIGLRNSMVSIYNRSMDVLFDEMVHPSYQYGEDGYVFFKVSENNFDQEFQEIYSSFIKDFQDYCESRGIGFLYTFEPSKATVYEEYLPKGYNYNNENLSYFISLLEEKSVNYLDNSEILINAKKDIQVFDQKYDAGHWNETGASIGISAMLDRLNELDNRVGSLDINNFEKVSFINETLPTSYFYINEETTHYNLINNNSIEINDLESEVYRDSNFRYFTNYKNENNEDGPRLLIFAGSYFNGKEKFLTENFSEVIKIHNYRNVIDYEYYINLFNPDLILFESTEYTHSDYYFPRDMMSSKISNKNIDSYIDLLEDSFVEIENTPLEKSDTNITNITNFSIPIESKDLLYAYANIDNRILDCKISKSENQDYIEFSIMNSDLENVDSIDLYFISKDEERYQKTEIYLD
ncbi:alginate O-acetyltransferase AlgX-related protein [Clostridium nigeriense]|uniref:alginate O-acetyltransferase AlgX-related protein n=1 Tax=Clostridium nigeriense TaxID=1805470 RepID=UPI003D3544B3